MIAFSQPTSTPVLLPVPDLTPAQSDSILSVAGLTKLYQRGREQIRALDNVSFDVEQGAFLAIVGPSGSGKSTLLNLIGCMDAPSSGSLQLFGKPVQHFKEKERTRLRRERIGFVFQHFGLVQTLTVAENVGLPAFFAGRKADGQVDELLAKVGLEHRRNHRPHELSGGEMQRAAIARALVNRPSLLLADEPTGNLDSVAGEGIIELFGALNREGLTIIVVTHNDALAAAARRRIQLMDGRIRHWPSA